MPEETPTSILVSYFLTQCFNKSMMSRLGEYSAQHSQTRTLANERALYLAQTEEAIRKIKDCRSIHQIRTHIRHQPIEVQWFIFERAMVLGRATKLDTRLSVRGTESPDKLPQKLFELLQQLWEEHLRHIAADNYDLDTHISHIVHGYL